MWQHYRDERVLTNAGSIYNFAGNSASFKIKQKITGSAGDDGTTVVKIMVPLKYLSNFCTLLNSWNAINLLQN